MATWILFDALLVCMLLLIVPIGFWRGGIREALVGGSVLAGALLANTFAESWGAKASDLLGVGPSTGRILIAQLLLWGTTVILGYGGGAVVRMGAATLLTRLSGAILSLFNGLLLISFSLSFINQFATSIGSPSSFREAYVARVLAGGSLEIVFLAVLLVALGVIAGLVARLAGGWDQDDDVLDVAPNVPYRWPAAPPTPRPTHVARSTAEDKSEPPSSATDFADYRRREETVTRPRFSPTAQLSDGASIHFANRVVPNVADLYAHRAPKAARSAKDEAQPPSNESPDGIRVVEEWLRSAPVPKRSGKQEDPGDQRPDEQAGGRIGRA
jgi:uncharacterized membrane protein required for colicin V production